MMSLSFHIIAFYFAPSHAANGTGGDAKSTTNHQHHARLCVITSRKDGRGYGFSMQAQKGEVKLGQYVGNVDKDSPAEEADLRRGDRIIEVNGSNVEKSTHKEVVEKIKAVPDSVQLLVVDEATDAYFKEKGIQVSSSMDDCVERKANKVPAATASFAGCLPMTDIIPRHRRREMINSSVTSFHSCSSRCSECLLHRHSLAIQHTAGPLNCQSATCVASHTQSTFRDV
jgi:hypothetical protein